MALHLIKLCVGCDSIEDLAAWQAERLRARRRAGEKKPRLFHRTFQMPKRRAELLDGGSLYWVIKGIIQVRQRLLAIRPFTDNEGIHRCGLVLEPKLVLTDWQPKSAFQGWRYFPEKDAPNDLRPGRGGDDLPPALRAELAELGLR